MKVIKRWSPEQEPQISTKELTNILIEREGISAIEIPPEETVSIRTRFTKTSLYSQEIEFKGPAVIIINQD
ncbi:BC1881 family protein [Bacillus sp. RO3]|nr:BC1881 family protein [Bacillus sp. RO3]